MVSEAQKVALAGLLHDIGKFSQRVGNEQRWKHEAFTDAFLTAFKDKLGETADEVQQLAASPHQQISDRKSLCVKLADWLASAERERKIQLQIAPERTALLSLPSQVRLDKEPEKPAFLPLHRFSLTEEFFFPTSQQTVSVDDYKQAWDDFSELLRQLPSPLPFSVWQTLLFVFTHSIPSATPWEHEPEKRTTPDISLFHHAKFTAAISSCLAAFPETELSTDELLHLRDLLGQYEKPDFLNLLSKDELATKKPICLLVRGDVAGIQSWLYRIARAEGEAHRRTAKRLRGRSFYLVLLTEAIADWLRRQSEMPPCNVLFCGGGVFDVLLPATKRVCQSLPEWKNKLDEWLLKEFFGELRVNIAWVTVTVADFYDFGSVYRRVTAELERRKLKAYESHLNDENFWFTKVKDICRFCDTTPFAEPTQPCEQCQLQEKLGDVLVSDCDYLIWAIGDGQKALNVGSQELIIRFSDLESAAAIVSEKTAKEIVRRWDGKGELFIRKRNDPQDWWKPLSWDDSKPVQAGIWWVASDAPTAKREWRCPTKPSDDPDAIVHEGEGLDFEEIASLSDGDDLLGVLRMDVDHLGAIFSIGVEPSSPSRIAELSGRIDAFFSAWLPNRCRLLTREWQESLGEGDERKGLVDNAFYLVYAGGDDLMVVGPWNLTLDLAWHIRNDFTCYCGGNPNMTISAGIIFVKPKFPIYRFAVLSGEAEERAKSLGRNCITAFNTTVAWDDYRSALKFGKELMKAVNDKEVPRTFLHFLWRLYRDHKEGKDPMWVPLLHYAIARRLKKEIVEQLQLLERIPNLINKKALPIALGYAILATRERGGV